MIIGTAYYIPIVLPIISYTSCKEGLDLEHATGRAIRPLFQLSIHCMPTNQRSEPVMTSLTKFTRSQRLTVYACVLEEVHVQTGDEGGARDGSAVHKELLA